MASSTFARLARTSALYVALVVPPLGALLAILHLGRGLAAPRAISGEWSVEPAASTAAPECPGHAFAQAHSLHISQSGPRAELVLDGDAEHELAIVLRGDEIAGTRTGRGDDPCARLAFDARLTGETDRAVLVGTLRSPGCGRCPDIAFRATRKPAAEE